jgi:hypothetical protein
MIAPSPTLAPPSTTALAADPDISLPILTSRRRPSSATPSRASGGAAKAELAITTPYAIKV